MHDVGDTVLGRYGDIEMDVLISHMPRAYGKAFPLCNVLEHALELLFNEFVLQYLATVLWTPHDVVVADPRTVGELVESSAHRFNHLWLLIRPKVILPWASP